ncbi:hypothetical protein SKPI104516_19640 [Skermania piniformis]
MNPSFPNGQVSGHSGAVQQQHLFGVGVEAESIRRLPSGEIFGDRRRQHVEVAEQPGTGEGLLHDPPVVQMLVEIQHQQATAEERAGEVVEAELVGERLVPIQPNHFLRFGTQHIDGVGAEHPGPADRSELGEHLPGPGDHVVHHRRIADVGQAGSARYWAQSTAGRWRGQRPTRAGIVLDESEAERQRPAADVRPRQHRQGRGAGHFEVLSAAWPRMLQPTRNQVIP